MKSQEILPYLLLDSGDGRKLEQAGPFRIIRPALNAFWHPTLPRTEWDKADAVFERESTGGGTWMWKNGLKQPEEGQWIIRWGGVVFLVKPTRFGHLGFFAEQIHNWEWMRSACAALPPGSETLNLFAYSGGATFSMAQGGANACHLDASKGIIDWAGKNLALNHDVKGKIRWICDDAMKFVAREARRGHKYQGICLDPPSFGRGAQGQVWKIENDVAELLENVKAILDTKGSFFILLTCHSQGFSAFSLGRMLQQAFPKFSDQVESGEMLIPETSKEGRALPAGLYARLKVNL